MYPNKATLATLLIWLRPHFFIKWPRRRYFSSSIYPMSIFVRPDSPPPRQPSPEIPHAPLPYPHHPRRAISQPKIKPVSPARPPGLQLPVRTVQSARSYDQIPSARSADDSLLTPRKRTPPTLKMQQPFGQEIHPRHMSTTLTVTTVHRRASVHVCPVANPPPPPSDPKRNLRPHPNSFDSLYLPEMHANAIPQRKPPSKSVLPPPLKKHKGLSMACLRFLRIRNPSQSEKIATTTFVKHWMFIMQNPGGALAFCVYNTSFYLTTLQYLTNPAFLATLLHSLRIPLTITQSPSFQSPWLCTLLSIYI